MLAKDNRKAKRRRGPSGDAAKDEGRVLCHSCWADDLYAMEGTMNLTRILEDMTNAIERLGMKALGTWLDNFGCSEASMWHRISKANSIFYAKKALFCDHKLPVTRRTDAFYSTCVPVALHGAGEWAYTVNVPGFAHLGIGESVVESFACAGDQTSAGLIT